LRFRVGKRARGHVEWSMMCSRGEQNLTALHTEVVDTRSAGFKPIGLALVRFASRAIRRNLLHNTQMTVSSAAWSMPDEVGGDEDETFRDDAADHTHGGVAMRVMLVSFVFPPPNVIDALRVGKLA